MKHLKGQHLSGAYVPSEKLVSTYKPAPESELERSVEKKVYSLLNEALDSEAIWDPTTPDDGKAPIAWQVYTTPLRHSRSETKPGDLFRQMEKEVVSPGEAKRKIRNW